MHPGTPWHEIGAAAEQVHKDAGFEPIRNLCGHELTRWNLHAGTSIPAHACGADNPGFKGGVQLGQFTPLSHLTQQENQEWLKIFS